MTTQNQRFCRRAPHSAVVAALALTLAGIVGPVSAANFQYRHLVYGLTAPVNPPSQLQQAAAEIVVALTGGPALPAGEVNWPYSYDLKQLLTITGESWSSPNVSWSLPAGALPAGLSLGADGVISGIPTTKDLVGANFQVKASYKGKDGQQVYTIVVNGAVLHVTQIAAGSLHTCAITTAGGVKCWGQNYYGQLGNNSTAASTVPVSVSGLSSNVIKVSAGGSHTCALTNTNGLKCWGRNTYGQLGDGTTQQRNTPVDVYQRTSGIASIAAGYDHTCAVTAAEGALCWGFNTNGQLGNGNSTHQLVPAAVSGLSTGVASISAGQLHTCAVTTTGSAKCWGQNGSYGLLGNNSVTDSITPVQVSGLTTGVARVAVGNLTSCALTTTGGVLCWGFNSYGQVGDGTTASPRMTPVAVSSLSSGVTTISVGYAHACAVTNGGALLCWGANGYGQLGDGTNTNRSSPVLTGSLSSGVSGIATGNGHACALTAEGPKCWGRNDTGQLGDNSTTHKTSPVNVSP